MRCGSVGCACSTCMDCGKLLEYCICDLRERAKALLNKDLDDYEFAAQARQILMEWLDA